MHSESVYFLVLPLASELAPVGPSVSSEALYQAISVFASVVLIIWPFLDSVSESLTTYIVAVEGAIIGPRLLPHSLLHILAELALVNEEVYVSGDSSTMIHVVGPLSLVSLALNVGELAKAMSAAKVPGTLVRCPVSKVHFATAVTETTEPLAFVGGSGRAIPMRACRQLTLKLGFV